MADNQLGPLLRLWGLSAKYLPPLQANADEIAPFLLALLQEAVAFIDTVDDKSETALWKVTGSKTYSGKEIGGSSEKKETVRVTLLERDVPRRTLKAVAAAQLASLGGAQAAKAVEAVLPPQPVRKPATETWVCRRSLHPNAAQPGTASWAEFRTHLKDHHAASELAMTPTVVEAREVLAWPTGPAGLRGTEDGGRRWSDFTLSLHEMRHVVGPVLKDRVFPVLQMTCAAVGDFSGDESQAEGANDTLLVPEFLVVSVTVDDFASESVHGDPAPAVAARLSSRPDIVVGAYASVERVRLLPTGVGDNRGTGVVEWVMATASDARGILPSWVQGMAVPGQISKDVRLFLRWLQEEERKKGSQASQASQASQVPQVPQEAAAAAAEGSSQPAEPAALAPAEPSLLIAPADTHP